MDAEGARAGEEGEAPMVGSEGVASVRNIINLIK